MTTSYIYVIGTDKPPYKVGISKNPETRLKKLQTGFPYKLKLHVKKPTQVDKVRLLETIIHRNIDNYKTNGEWFDIDLKDLLLEIDFALIRYEDDPLLKTLARDKILFNRFR